MEMRQPLLLWGVTIRCEDSTMLLALRMRYIARAIEERGTAAVIVLTKWDAVPNKDAWTLTVGLWVGFSPSHHPFIDGFSLINYP